MGREREPSERVFAPHRQTGGSLSPDGGFFAGRYFEADSAVPTTACPAASRAVSTRNGEQLT